jgi:hypothetical protein
MHSHERGGGQSLWTGLMYRLLYLWRIELAVLEPGVGAPVLQVDGDEAADDELQLPLVKALEQLLGNQLVETCSNPRHVKELKFLY